jgi:eukaryotic-like serine/threonine-protein kinase
VGHAASSGIPRVFLPDPRYEAMTYGQLRPLADSDPRQLGGFKVLGLLGEGGMGRVFFGRSPGGWAVAIKVIHAGLAADPAFRARFAHEVATARAVGGIYTASVVDADTAAERPWLAVEFVVGPSLSDAVTAGGPLPLPAVLRLGLGLAEALQAIHAAGVVHRDLKPSNVLLAADGPRVIDFGIARAAEHSSLTRTGTILGSAGFMAPEQITGAQTGPAADIFALGAVLTFAATAQGPFGEGRTEALAYRVVHTDPALDGVPHPVREIVARCLAKDPLYRPAPGDVIAALAAIHATGPGAGQGWLPHPVERLIGLRQVDETAAVPPSPAPVPAVSPEPVPEALMDDSAIPTGTSLGAGRAGTTPITPQVPPALLGPPGLSGPPGPARPQRGAARRRTGWLLAAAAFGVVLVVAVAVAVVRLSAAPPAPSAGLAAGTSTVASPPASPTPSGPASPVSSSPASSLAPSPSPTPSGPAAVVRAYYAAINNHDCGTAWNLGGDNLSAAQGQTYQQFCQGFSTTSHDILTVDSVAGNTVTVTIVAEHADGSSQTYRGSYHVGNGVIQSASVQAAS